MFGYVNRPTGQGLRASSRVDVTVVHAPACHFCDDAVQALSLLAERFPLSVSMIALESDEGLRLTAKHRPAMNPLVLVDNRFFSAGRLPRKKLTALLEHVTLERGAARGNSAMAG